jgi:hypothetical protein
MKKALCHQALSNAQKVPITPVKGSKSKLILLVVKIQQEVVIKWFHLRNNIKTEALQEVEK